MVRKAVIPAAGFGTRMLPAAKAVPKEMLPVLDRPTIQYVVEEAAAAGAADVLLVTSRDKRAIEDHFDRSPELESRLASSGKSALLASIDALMAKVKIHATRQAEQKGLGHAVLQARPHVGDEPFLCLLGDTIFSPRTPGAPLPCRQLVDAYAHLQTPIIGLEQVLPDKVERYGIVGGAEISPGVFRLDTLVEKPARASAPSNLAIAARYVLTPDLFDCLDQTPAGKGGEIQLTDALKLLLARRPIHGVVLQSKRHDIGNPVDWLKTNLYLARKDPTLWREIVDLVQRMKDEG
ncbi:MAG TPA: UTP--glucose-1-phosphate uridylyltransferase GalU [Tepidisphaeraceae bacterium]|nr:UTP--glucose-1-phosphate uridylyltransferase GalU [Tepidisphaeraceae bacterium]